MKSLFTIILIAIIISVISSGCFQLFGPGPDTVLKAVLTPSKNNQAILFIKGGNANEADSYQVSVTGSKYSLGNTDVGNTFTTDSNHGATQLDSNSIKLTWIDNSTLQIKYDRKLRTFIQERCINKVNIVYLPY